MGEGRTSEGPKRRARLECYVRSLSKSLLFVLAMVTIACEDPLDICAPIDDRIGFFSQGDCVFTRAPFFRGHEWITYFGNEQLSDADSFTPSQVEWMALGNRRVDYPKELLVHLDNGVLAYVRSITAHTEQIEVQPHHFLLGERDSEEEAARKSRRHIFDTTLDALRLWTDNRSRSLTLLGRAQHAIQDSFSSAHTVRRTDDELYGATNEEGRVMGRDGGLDGDSESSAVAPCRGACACIQRVKAYIRRAPGFREGILYHGTDEDSVGHITSQDSIYRSGRDCHRPESAGDVWRCLDRHARQGVQGTAAYLLMVRQLINDGTVGDDLQDEEVVSAFERFEREHLTFCDAL